MSGLYRWTDLKDVIELKSEPFDSLAEAEHFADCFNDSFLAEAICVKGQPKTNQASLFHKSVSRMTGEEFEKYCADYLRRHGYWNVKCTPLSGDYGADIIAHKNGKKWVFQCKRYSKKVGNKAVQEVVAAKVHYGASEAGIMTNSELTPNAKKLAYENKVVIYEKIW